VGNRKQALLDGRATDRKAILSELTGSAIPAADRVENFVSLFRASHLFSQEQQELTKDFQGECQLSADIVSRMLAFEDYANAVNKAARVRDVLQTAIVDASEEIRILTEQIATDNKELERLGQTAKSHTNIEALDTEIDALRGKLERVGITVTPEKPDATMVRGWRAALESRHSQSQATSGRLTALAKEVAGLPRSRAESAAVKHQIAQKEGALKAAEEKRVAAELAVQRAEQRLAEMTAKRVEVQTNADLLEWVRNNQPGYARLVSQQRELGAELQRATGALTQLRAAEDKAVGELRSREAAVAHVTEKLKAQRAELAGVQMLQQVIPSWQTNRTRLGTVLQSEQAQLKTLDSLRTEERELAPQLTAVAGEEARLARQIGEADKNQSELRSLVSQLQGHVRTGTCPLCGEDHGSKDQLLQRIQKHVVADAASGARADLTGVRERVKRLAEHVAANKQKQQASEKQLATLKEERVRLETEIACFSAAASKLAIAVEAADPTPAEQAQVLASRLQQEVAGLEKQSQAAGGAIGAAQAAVANARNAVLGKKTEADEKTAALARAQEEANRLRSNPRLTRVSLDIEPGQLAELERLNLKQTKNSRPRRRERRQKPIRRSQRWGRSARRPRRSRRSLWPCGRNSAVSRKSSPKSLSEWRSRGCRRTLTKSRCSP
jgi:DNA repair protein SbcC/Rad50